jgi:MraZ protein
VQSSEKFVLLFCHLFIEKYMLIGQYDVRVGEKNQVAVPKKFRDHLGTSLYITKGFEHCLIMVSEASWKTLLEGTEGKPFTDKSSRELQRFFLGNAVDVSLDAQGRFVIPDFLRDYAHITKDVVFAGMQRFVEVWDKTQWDEHQKELANTIESIAERLSEKEMD